MFFFIMVLKCNFKCVGKTLCGDEAVGLSEKLGLGKPGEKTSNLLPQGNCLRSGKSLIQE